MAGYLNPIGNEPSVRLLPAQRTLITADSRYRFSDVPLNSDLEPSDSVYNFNAKLSAGIVGKELVYQRLYWSQPIYSHNNSSSEIRFHINGDEMTVYVVYATPYVIFTEYDGNDPGVTFGVPKPYSYAAGMEMAFNGDVREMPWNLQLVSLGPQAGYLYDANGFLMTLNFRYSPSKGFCISFAPSVNPAIPVYTIRLLDSDYFANAHSVHGFGIGKTDPVNGVSYFGPRDMWTVSYFSDDTPNLLPLRYITIRSTELTKDRRMISFQNANAARFQNELAIISLSKDHSGTFHSEIVGDDATVISKRDDYQPQSFRIQITDEGGQALICDDIIGNMMQEEGISYSISGSLWEAAYLNRGNPTWMNMILFGSHNAFLYSISQSPRYTQALVPVGDPITVPPYGGFLAKNTGPYNSWPSVNFGYVSQAMYVGTVSSARLWEGKYLNYGGIPLGGYWDWTYITDTSNPLDPSYIGFNPNGYPTIELKQQTYNPAPSPVFPPYRDAQRPYQFVFEWDTSLHPRIGCRFDLNVNSYYRGYQGEPWTRVVFGLGVFGPPIGSTALKYAYYDIDPVNFYLDFYGTFSDYSPNFQGWDSPNSFFNASDPKPIWGPFTNTSAVTAGEKYKVSFFLLPIILEQYHGESNFGAPTYSPPADNAHRYEVQCNYGNVTTPNRPRPLFQIYGFDDADQPYYIPTVTQPYEYGNPQAIAKCEELIHELAVVTDKN